MQKISKTKKIFKPLALALLIKSLLVILTVNSAFAVDIIKSANDNREYRHITLKNGLSVILVSDDDAIRSSAAVSVEVGSYDNPDDILGLAHFTEHMLFLGTKKFPDAGEYSNFLNIHNGSSNAFTSPEKTVYFFDVDNNHFEGALDRFSQFFISPNFNPELVDREINAINAEYSLGAADDMRKVYQVSKIVFNEDSPHSRFNVGNFETLKKVPNIRQRMLEFYQEHYFSSNMHLVLVGKKSLDDLAKYANQYFLPIKDKKPATNSYNIDNVIDKKKLGSSLKVKTTKSHDSLTLNFFLDPIKDQYKTKSLAYVTRIIGNESEGSLLSVLKEERLASALVAWFEDDDFYSSIGVDIKLTEKGKKNLKLVKQLFFKNIALMSKNEPKKWRFEEFKTLDWRYFENKPKEEPSELAVQLAVGMSKIPIKDILVADYDYQNYDAALIKKVIRQISPVNMLAVNYDDELKLANPSFEKWYNIAYEFSNYNSKYLQDLTDYTQLRGFELKLPAASRFLNNPSTKTPNIKAFSAPKKILSDKRMDFWFFTEQKIDLENAIIKIGLKSPKIGSLVNYNLNTLLLEYIWQQRINEKIYDAIEAGMGYELKHTKSGFEIDVFGTKDFIKEVLSDILNLIQDESLLTKNALADAKENLSQTFENFEKEAPLDKSFQEFITIQQGFAHNDELKAHLDKLSLNQLREFKKAFFESSKVYAYLQGNFDQKAAFSFASLIKNNVKNTGSLAKDLLEHSISDLPKGHSSLIDKSLSNDSTLIRVYQGQTRDLKTLAGLIMLEKFIQEPFYTRIRTIEQVGYVVQNFSYFDKRVPYVFFIVQSPEHQPDEINRLVTEFIEKTSIQTIEKITDEIWQTTKQTVIEEISEYPKVGYDLAEQFWSNIKQKNYGFKRSLVLLPHLKDLSKQDMLEIWQNLINDKTKKQLDIWMIGKNKDPIKTATSISIKNKIDFKNSLIQLSQYP